MRHLPFKKECAHIIFAFEITEHLDKQQGQKFLVDLQTLASQVIVSMPNGYFEQDAIKGNSNERHLACWQRQDLAELGYTVEKTGLAMDIEGTMKKYRLYDLYHMLKRKYRNHWVGTILIGTYNKRQSAHITTTLKEP